MKNFVTSILAVLLCLILIACGTTDVLNNTHSTAIPGSPTGTAPIVSIQDAAPIPNETDIASSWTVNDTITFSLLQDTYPTGTKKLTMILENRGEATLTYGEVISFEKYIDGQWKPVKTIDQYLFHSIAYLLPPHSVKTFTIDPWFLESPLDTGLYRVTGDKITTNSDSDQRTEYPAWQLEFRIAEDAQPEPDFAVYVSSIPLQIEEDIPVYIINTTGKENSVLLIPHLERRNTAGEWEEVPYVEGIGFCGTSDPLPIEGKDWSEQIQSLWGILTPGRYRLSYDITGNETAIRTAGGEFDVEAALCAYPTAESFP